MPHPAVGAARRMMVPRGRTQADIMLQALTNHTPAAIVVDELSHAAEVCTAATLSPADAERKAHRVAFLVLCHVARLCCAA